MLGKQFDTLIQKVFKKQRLRAEQDDRLIKRSSKHASFSFDSLPLETQKQLLQNEAVRNVVNIGKQEADRIHANH